MIYKKFVVMGLAFFAILFNVSFTMSVQAQTFDKIIPTYGLFCEDSELIKSGTVNFDLTDTELLSNGMGVKHSEYRIAVANREVELAIPFISSAKNVPAISVSVNGQTVEGAVWYGHSGFWQDYEFDIDKTYSPVLDENLIGTLYTVIPDSDTITVSLKFSEIRSYIYETSSAYSSSQSADGSDVWTLKNALSKSSYSFFVLGDSTVCTFESSCEYKMEQLTCKEYIDSQYKYYEEYYEYLGGVPIELFYSIVNRVIINNTNISYEELFTNSINTNRINAYKFKLVLASNSIISYEIAFHIQSNSAYSPIIYGVEQKKVGSYPIAYTIELSNDVPYIIESSIVMQRNGLSYTAETADDFSFVVSASEQPINSTTGNNNVKTNRTMIIVCSVVGSVVLIGIVVFIGVTLNRRRTK